MTKAATLAAVAAAFDASLTAATDKVTNLPALQNQALADQQAKIAELQAQLQTEAATLAAMPAQQASDRQAAQADVDRLNTEKTDALAVITQYVPDDPAAVDPAAPVPQPAAA